MCCEKERGKNGERNMIRLCSLFIPFSLFSPLISLIISFFLSNLFRFLNVFALYYVPRHIALVFFYHFLSFSFTHTLSLTLSRILSFYRLSSPFFAHSLSQSLFSLFLPFYFLSLYRCIFSNSGSHSFLLLFLWASAIFLFCLFSLYLTAKEILLRFSKAEVNEKKK